MDETDDLRAARAMRRAELDELLFQLAGYGGVPAGVAARRALQAVRAEREAGAP